MTVQLRPLSLGELLDRTAELYRKHFLLFAGIAAIFSGIMLVMQLLHLGVLSLLGYPNVAQNVLWGSASASVVVSLLVLLIAGLSIAANNRAVAWVYLGQTATIRNAIASIVPRLRRYLWVMTIAVFRAWAPLGAMYIAFFVILLSVLPRGFLTNPAAASTVAHQNPSTFLYAGVGFLILAPFLLVAAVYGVWMSLRYSLAVPACVVENLPARQAIKRSIELSLGARGQIFVLGLLVYAIRLLLGILFGFPLLAYTLKHPGHPIPLGWMSLQQVAAFAVNALIGPIYSTGLTLFYYDQRIRKEGYDIEWMMQAAGLMQQPEFPATEQI